MRNRQGSSLREGAVVVEVMPNTPAEQAGLREGDVITKVNDEPISSPEDLREAIQDAGPGHEVTMDVVRGKRHREVTARLEEGSAEFGQRYGFSEGDQSREIHRLQQRIDQLERRLRRLEQSRQSQSPEPCPLYQRARFHCTSPRRQRGPSPTLRACVSPIHTR